MVTKIKILNGGDFVYKRELRDYEGVRVECPVEGPNGEDYLSILKSISSYDTKRIIAGLINDYAELGFEFVEIGRKRWLKDKNTGAAIYDPAVTRKRERCTAIVFELEKVLNITEEGRKFALSMRKINFLFANYIKHLYEEQEAIKNQQAIEKLVQEYRKESA